MHKTTPRFGSIIFALGMLGNHVRWMLFLDPKFPNPWGAQDIGSKLKFIQDNIYPRSRTWNNWLGVEWKYRVDLDREILLAHENWHWEQNPDSHELYLTCENPELPWLHYYHLNLGLNNNTPESMLHYFENWISELSVISANVHQYTNKKVLTIDSLFAQKLDRDLYLAITDFFGFQDLYEHAQTVQDLHYLCRQTSAQDFFEYFTAPDFSQRLDKIKLIAQGQEFR